MIDIWKLNAKVKKVTCPSCGWKYRFVRYINQDGNLAPEQFGCCDRKNSCGYINRPGKETTPTKTHVPPPQPISFTPITKVNKNYKDNNLYLFLKQKFGAQETNLVCKKYEIGSSNHWPKSTIFWFKDVEKRYRGGMIILYNSETGKRIRDPFPHNTYVHKAEKYPEYNYSMCLFGEHLISKDKKIGVVEAPKTALILSIVWPEYTWVATNGLTTLQPYFLKPLEGLDIVLFPDKQPDEFTEKNKWVKDYWENKIPELSKICKSVKLFQGLFSEKEGTDLADII